MYKTTGLIALAASLLGACQDATLPAEPSVGEPSLRVEWGLASTMLFTSTRDDPANPFVSAEIYSMDPGGTNLRRLTENSDGEAYAVLSPDGKKVVFDSNRLRAVGEPINTTDLFVMSADGSEEAHLTRGSSATWSPDGKSIAFQRSASGTALPIKPDAGAATFDSDVFIANVDDLLAGTIVPQNLTNSPDMIDDDPDWSPEGQRVVYVRHDVTDNHLNSVTAEVYLIGVDGAGITRLTFNTEEERGPAWSPDGARIVFMCRRGGPDFEICVMNADGTGQVQLTNNSMFDGTPTWSPDGAQILFHRTLPGLGQQLLVMNADGTGQVQLTNPPGSNFLASWGERRVRGAP